VFKLKAYELKVNEMMRALLKIWFFCGLTGIASAATHYQLPSGEVLTDPTAPSYWNASKRSKKVSHTHFSLNYIRLSTGHKSAMINGKKLTEGDQISGARVIKIKQDSVTLKVNGHFKTLRLNKKFRLNRKATSQ